MQRQTVWYNMQYQILYHIFGTLKLLSKIVKASFQTIYCVNPPRIYNSSILLLSISYDFLLKSEEVWIKSKPGVTLSLSPLEHILIYQNTDSFLSVNVIILAAKTIFFQDQD